MIQNIKLQQLLQEFPCNHKKLMENVDDHMRIAHNANKQLRKIVYESEMRRRRKFSRIAKK